MDYESRKIKWYWLLVFTVYCGAVVYLLFQGNPYLYSHNDLRSSLDVGETVHRQTIPSHPEIAQASAPTFQARYNLQRTAVDPTASPHSKNYTEYEAYPVDLSAEGLEVQNITQDSSGLFLSGKSSWVVALGLDGKVRWKYRFKELSAERSVLPVLIDQTSAYIVHPQGAVICLDKLSGEIRWITNIKEEVVAAPLLWKKNLIIPTKAASGVQMTAIDRENGQSEEESQHLEIKPGFQLSEAPDLHVFIAAVDNKVIALNPEDWQTLWSQTLTDPIKGPAVVVGTQIFVATLAAKVVKIDGAKKGKLEWEAETVKPPASAPSFIPVTGRLAVLDTNGFISTIDAKSGKVYWRFPTENRNPLTETWSARLKGQHIEEFKMDWLHKGWTIWSPCYDNSFCIYTPNKGQVVTRVKLSGRPLALPLPVDHRWVFLSHTKGANYILSQIVEDAEIKKLKAEAGSKNP